MTTEVREATADDLQEVARIHKSRFCTKHYALGQFSLPLIRGYYTAFLGRCVFLVHVSERRIDGFLLGGDHEELRHIAGKVYRKLILRCFLESFTRPGVWSPAIHSVLKAIRKRREKPVRSQDFPRLLSLAVDEAAEGTGAAIALVAAFEDRLRGKYSAYELKVVKTNHRALRFYEKLGMVIVPSNSPNHYTFRKVWEPSDKCP
jgi:ribosomal protein S18 acetylase RimI-like enzyme